MCLPPTAVAKIKSWERPGAKISFLVLLQGKIPGRAGRRVRRAGGVRSGRSVATWGTLRISQGKENSPRARRSPFSFSIFFLSPIVQSNLTDGCTELSRTVDFDNNQNKQRKLSSVYFHFAVSFWVPAAPTVPSTDAEQGTARGLHTETCEHADIYITAGARASLQSTERRTERRGGAFPCRRRPQSTNAEQGAWPFCAGTAVQLYKGREGYRPAPPPPQRLNEPTCAGRPTTGSAPHGS